MEERSFDYAALRSRAGTTPPETTRKSRVRVAFPLRPLRAYEGAGGTSPVRRGRRTETYAKFFLKNAIVRSQAIFAWASL